LAYKQTNWALPLKEDYDPSVVLEQPVTKRHRGEEIAEGSATFYKFTSNGLRDLVAAALKMAHVDGAAALASMPALERVGAVASLITDRGISTGTPELLVALSKTLDEVAILAASDLKIDCIRVAAPEDASNANKAKNNNTGVYKGIAAIVNAIFSVAPSKAASLLSGGGGTRASSLEKLFNVAKVVYGGMQTGKLTGRAGGSFFHSLAPFVGIDGELFVRASVAARTGEVLKVGETKEAALCVVDDMQSVPLVALGEDRVTQLRSMIQSSIAL
jgi:hypothetical protein